MENIQHNASVLSPSLNSPTSSVTRPGSIKALKRLSNYRLAVGWAVLVFWITSIFALDWDVQWHVNVGRDGFWTPPHWMFYSTIAAAGTLCLGLVLLETFLYYRRYPGITDQTTTSALFFFRGPVGFMLAGFGMLVMLISAPFDDYWHRIYGIDVEIWTPFHIMLLLGIITANLGIVYLFASEMNRRKSWQADEIKPEQNFGLQKVGRYLQGLVRPATLGLILASLLLLTRYWSLMAETFLGKTGPGTLQIGAIRLPSYSLALALVPIVLVMLVNFTGRIGVATFAGVLFVALRLAIMAFLDWGVKTLAVDQGVTLRPGASDVALIPLTYPLFLPLAGLLVDLVYLATRRWRSNGKPFRAGLVAAGAALGAGVILFLGDKPWEAYNAAIDNVVNATKNPFAVAAAARLKFNPSYWEGLPLVMLIAALAGLVGLAFATSLRYTDQ